MSRGEVPKNILVMGGAGYLGSVLVSQLLAVNCRVTVIDSLLFGDESARALGQMPGCECIRGDIRDVRLVKSVMRKSDAVVHLAAIVGDAVCDENQKLAIDVNRDATISLSELAREAGVRRFIFASSCSVYGKSESLVDEDSNLRPLSLYAEMKVNAERHLIALSSQYFAPTVIRLGTLFGLSGRMRFDLVVNQLVGNASLSGKVDIFGGDQWRPFLHVQDAARAFVSCLSKETHAVAGRVFNAGSEMLNHTIREVGEAVVRAIPSTSMCIEPSKHDTRSYNVSFARIQSGLNFKCKRDLSFGILEVYEAIRSAKMLPAKPQYHNHLAMRQLRLPSSEVQLHEGINMPHNTAESTRAA